jgi:beta-galactosidase
MKKGLLEIKKEGFFIDGEKFYITSGDIHYFRFHPDAWKRHFMLAKDFGLTAIQTYVPWNLHESEKGNFNFNGRLDLCAFLEMADSFGLKVLLRPSPYLCSECDFGGLPVWLYRNGDIDIRCSSTVI